MTEAIDERTTTAESKFWTNDLIWNDITSYLRISDLKALSLVNKHFLKKVRAKPRLIFKQTLKKDLKLNVPTLHKAIVEVDSVDLNCLTALGSDIFENVLYLELQHIGRLTKEIKHHVLINILCNCKNLKSLSLKDHNFFFKNYQYVLKESGVKKILSQLEELFIGTVNEDASLYDYFRNSPAPEPYAVDNFFLPSLNFKLKKFVYREPFKSRIFENSSFCPKIILGSSLNSLVDISLKLNLHGINRLSALHFPNLIKLQLEIDGGKEYDNVPNYSQVFADNLIPFTRGHLGTLEMFSLNSAQHFCLEPFCNVFKNSKKIKLLCFITFGTFTRSFRTLNWNFLQTLSTLRSLELKMSQYAWDSGSEQNDSADESEDTEDEEAEEIQVVSPKNGFLRRCFPALPSTLTTIRFSGFLQDNDAEYFPVTIELQRFKNLTELSMLDCSGFLVDDKTLQFICSHLTKIRILKCEFHKITDFGISGLKNDGSESGISLKNLKGLNTLVMSNEIGYSWGISWKGILKAIQFLELIQLEVQGPLKHLYKNNDGNDGSNYLKLIQQNPSLEICSLKFYQPRNSVRQEALRVHSRIKLE